MLVIVTLRYGIDVKLTKKSSKKQNSAGSTLVAINKKRGDTASPRPADS